MAKVSLYEGSTVMVEGINGEKEYWSARNGVAYKFLFVGDYIRRGYEIEPKLLALYERDKHDKQAAEDAAINHKNACIQQAIATGKPVVVSSCGYSTTASVGTNYAVAMPNGQIWSVQSGNSRASHGDKTAYHISVCGVSESDRNDIIAAIREYNS